MSMSQEEIEALMSGAGDIEEDDTPEELEEDSSDDIIEDDNVDEVLAGIDGVIENDEDSSDIEDYNDSEVDLSGIDGIVDDTSSEESKSEIIEDLIDSSQYPLPAKAENKVVNQLNEVAEDSEEKATQIFDVLSFILDENNDIQSYNKQMAEFIEKQKTLLESLTVKFPNINAFSENLELAKELTDVSKNLSDKVDGENNKVFEAMELMQYHDINRQKIERVMAVIKKLNMYLNGIFEDDSGKAEVQIAKHISGDSSDIVDADDIESLISEING